MSHRKKTGLSLCFCSAFQESIYKWGEERIALHRAECRHRVRYKQEAIELDIKNPKLRTMGCICNIKEKGSLRGCIGHVQAIMLCIVSYKNAIAASSSDPRFPDDKKWITGYRDRDFHSLPMQRLKDIKNIQVGKARSRHQKRFSERPSPSTGATEQGWDRQTFSTNLRKAGLRNMPGKMRIIYFYGRNIKVKLKLFSMCFNPKCIWSKKMTGIYPSKPLERRICVCKVIWLVGIKMCMVLE